MTLWLILSIGLNLVLAGAVGFTLWRQRQFRKPFDPRVSVYVQRKDKHGWLTDGMFGRFGEVQLSRRPADAAVFQLSEVRDFVNILVQQRYYVKVVRIVHPEHWHANYRPYKSGVRHDEQS